MSPWYCQGLIKITNVNSFPPFFSPTDQICVIHLTQNTTIHLNLMPKARNFFHIVDGYYEA